MMLPGSSFSTGCWSLSLGIPSSRKPSLTTFPCRAERACDPPPGCPRPGWGPRPAARHGFATATGLLLSLCRGWGGVPVPVGFPPTPHSREHPASRGESGGLSQAPGRGGHRPSCGLTASPTTRVKTERSRQGPAAQSSGGDGCGSGVGAGAPTHPSPCLQECACPAGD